MRPQSRRKHITYYKPINYLVIDKILTCPTFLVHLTVCHLYFSLISLSNNAIHKFSDYRLNTISDRQDVATPLRAYCRPDERANTVRHCLQSVILISEQQTDNQQLYSINILQTREKYRESVKATNYINR